MSTTAILADGLLDDAAMFPPRAADPGEAISDHVRHRRAWYSRLVGPLLVDVRRWPDFVRAHEEQGQPPLALVVIGTDERPQPVPAEVSIVGFELVAPDDVAALLDSNAGVALEVPDLDRLDMVADRVGQLREHGVPAVLKYRTGGTTAAAFPPAADAARVVAAAVGRDIPVKFTAGLHRAVRHRDDTTGFEHHGFLNLLIAVAAAQHGAPESELVQLLDRRDQDQVAATIAAWTSTEVAQARSIFVSFGCCGVTDPVSDLVALGLVEEHAA